MKEYDLTKTLATNLPTDPRLESRPKNTTQPKRIRMERHAENITSNRNAEGDQNEGMLVYIYSDGPIGTAKQKVFFFFI